MSQTSQQGRNWARCLLGLLAVPVDGRAYVLDRETEARVVAGRWGSRETSRPGGLDDSGGGLEDRRLQSLCSLLLTTQGRLNHVEPGICVVARMRANWAASGLQGAAAQCLLDQSAKT